MPKTGGSQSLIEEISEHFSVKVTAPLKRKQVFFDTFDWRLYNKQSAFTFHRNEWQLISLIDGSVVEKCPAGTKTAPKFWQDFPDGSLKDELKRILDVRALLPLMSIETSARRIDVLNEDAKIVLRVYVEEIGLLKNRDVDELLTVLKLLPLKGYQKELRMFKQHGSFTLGVALDFKGLFMQLCRAANKQPGGYSSKLNLAFDLEMPAVDAVKILLLNLHAVIVENEAGIKADIDTEFLHDFRVAIRRTRSAISQIKGIFPEDDLNRFRNDFSLLGKSTNRLRDLDVYLLKKQRYKNLLPEFLQPGLDPLFDILAKERDAEQKKLKKYLNSESYKNQKAAWQAFLNSAPGTAGEALKNAAKPVLKVACKLVRKKYKRVIALGRKINADAPNSEFHALRIECKKLRYLLEFFYSLFPGELMDVLIKHLKNLQNNLGDFNDLVIQQNNLRKYLEEDAFQNSNSKTAIGGLITALHQRQASERSAFFKTFEAFASEENSKLVDQLLQQR